ncbi:MAG TPA: bifunctional glutamate N-acetyltransferase/amino-acid acetyltransferase ArgJ [Deltaproteobacteria bacterium]|nr:bifunctional glutamate N-acetyltransferase/amino-acid acetyltransferase ArgJ [Deltaproteobacteria bacterium]
MKGFHVKGFRAAGVHCGVKKVRKDLAVIVSDVPCVAAGLFTTNRVKAPSVLFSSRRVASGSARGVVVNSGNANVSTGGFGRHVVERMAAATEKAVGAEPGEVLVCQTGVIGVAPPLEKIEAGIERAAARLAPSGLVAAAEAMRTTDAFSKTALLRGGIGGVEVTVAGIAKGAGMISPRMATMLAFFLTDARLSPPALRRALKAAVSASFNRIVVDGDQSTNDTVLAFANGLAGGPLLTAGCAAFAEFVEALSSVARELALMIVRDGEGATKVVTVDVRGAATDGEAEKAARKLACSPLVKTAFFGCDPNWGRFMAALGDSGARFDPDEVDLYYNGVQVVRRGLDAGAGKEAARALREDTVEVIVELGAGGGSYRLWTCDLTDEYVRINSSYRS